MLPELVYRRILDPRPAHLAAMHPIQDAVNIPLNELPRRTHELPPSSVVIQVAAEPGLYEQTAAQLIRLGRQCARVSEFVHSFPPPTQIGRLWKPNPYLENTAHALDPGRALDLGCGTGRNAVYLVSRGWSVTAVDHLPSAIKRGRGLAQVSGVAEEQIEWVVSGAIEFVRSVTGQFDLVTLIRFLDIPVLLETKRLLKTGGSLVCELFSSACEPGDRIHRTRPEICKSALLALLDGMNIRESSVAQDERGRAVLRLHATRGDSSRENA